MGAIARCRSDVPVNIGPVDLDWMLSPYVGLAYIVPGNMEPVGSIQIDKSKVCDAIGT